MLTAWPRVVWRDVSNRNCGYEQWTSFDASLRDLLRMTDGLINVLPDAGRISSLNRSLKVNGSVAGWLCNLRRRGGKRFGAVLFSKWHGKKIWRMNYELWIMSVFGSLLWFLLCLCVFRVIFFWGGAHASTHPTQRDSLSTSRRQHDYLKDEGWIMKDELWKMSVFGSLLWILLCLCVFVVYFNFLMRLPKTLYSTFFKKLPV